LRFLLRSRTKIRDNVIIEYLMGEFYGTLGDKSARMCMEASFLSGGANNLTGFRPVRKMKVNGGSTEKNFIAKGPLFGASSPYE
jgi:hypothetical protein